MDDVLSLLASLDESEIEKVLEFLIEYKNSIQIEKKLEKLTNRLRMQGVDEYEIESSRICRLRVMKVINMDQAICRLTELYKTENK